MWPRVGKSQREMGPRGEGVGRKGLNTEGEPGRVPSFTLLPSPEPEQPHMGQRDSLSGEAGAEEGAVTRRLAHQEVPVERPALNNTAPGRRTIGTGAGVRRAGPTSPAQAVTWQAAGPLALSLLLGLPGLCAPCARQPESA